jgi:hypothetical protein
VDRRVALGVLWALFAAASVGVGFGAAGLVSDPFTDSNSDVIPVSVPATTTATGPSETPGESPSASPTGTATPSDPASTGTPAATADETVVRGFSTRAGFVSGSCRAGLVAVSASPAVGWSIDDVDGGRRDEARVRFEHSDGDGRVEVTAWCERGVPRFSAEDRDRGEDDDDGSGSSGAGSGHG